MSTTRDEKTQLGQTQATELALPMTDDSNPEVKNQAAETSTVSKKRKRDRLKRDEYDALVDARFTLNEDSAHSKRRNNFIENRSRESEQEQNGISGEPNLKKQKIEKEVDPQKEVEHKQEFKPRKRPVPKPKPVKLIDYVENPPAGFQQFQDFRYFPGLKQFGWLSEKTSEDSKKINASQNSKLTNLNRRCIEHIGGRKIVRKGIQIDRVSGIKKREQHRKEFKAMGLCVRGRQKGQYAFLMQDENIAKVNPFFTVPKEGYDVADAVFKFYFPLDKFPPKEQIEEFKTKYSVTPEQDKEAKKDYQILSHQPHATKKILMVGATPKPSKPNPKSKKKRKQHWSSNEAASESDISDHSSDFISSESDTEEMITKPMDTSSNNSSMPEVKPKQTPKSKKPRAQKPKSNPVREEKATNAAGEMPMYTSSSNELAAEPALQIPVEKTPAQSNASAELALPASMEVQSLMARSDRRSNGTGTAGIHMALAKKRQHPEQRKESKSEEVPMQVEKKPTAPFAERQYGSTLFNCHPNEFQKRMFVRSIVGSNTLCKRIFTCQDGYKWIECNDTNLESHMKNFQREANKHKFKINFAIREHMPTKLLLLSKDINNQVNGTPESSRAALELLKKFNNDANAKSAAEAKRLAEEDRARMSSIKLYGI